MIRGRVGQRLRLPAAIRLATMSRRFTVFCVTFTWLTRLVSEMAALMESPEQSRSLVEQAKAGDREAFGRLVEDAEERLRAALHASLSRDIEHIIDVEEVLQEAVVRGLRSIRSFEWQGEDSFSAWLRGIARNIVLDAIRRKRPHYGLTTVESAAPSDGSPSKALRRDERFERLKRTLQGLRPDHREVLLLSRIDGLSVRDIAARMERSTDAVKQLLSRALKALRASFGDTESLRLPDRRLSREDFDDAR